MRISYIKGSILCPAVHRSLHFLSSFSILGRSEGGEWVVEETTQQETKEEEEGEELEQCPVTEGSLVRWGHLQMCA